MTKIHRLGFGPALLALMLAVWAMGAGPARAEWKPVPGSLMTRWAKEVSPTNAHPEYPRPQMARARWMSLNGLWQYQPGNEGDALPTGTNLSSEILVPFPVESALSGVKEHHDRLWYRRSFAVPAAWKGQRVRLNFGAVDFETEVYVNGKSAGTHRGGYEPFQYDITPYLISSGPQELIVRVLDATDDAGEPRGKQTLHPGGIMYTSTTGIWQSVWLEPVAQAAIGSLHMVPDIDKNQIRMTVSANGTNAASRVLVTIKDGSKVVKTATIQPNVETALTLSKPKLWSPSSPMLYSVGFTLVQNGANTDTVHSYFGMRKISLAKAGGVTRMMLNNKFVFELGPLDQGFWPDGLYTAPTDAATKADIQAMKTLGFNMVRKHIKVEPARWYYWTDKLGLLVWQDMPSENSYTDHPQPQDKPEFEKQLRTTIRTHWNAPSIIMWVIFNESQGQYDEAGLNKIAKTLDPSRLTDRNSGGGDDSPENGGDIGDLDDVHSYPPPNYPTGSATQALACGEFGGIGFYVPGHMWSSKGNGYVEVQSPRELTDLYAEFTYPLKGFRDQHGLSAAVYTELTDVETEINGLLTYDRTFKCNPALIRQANQFAYPLPTYVTLSPTAEDGPQDWRYTTDAPPAEWNTPGFDASAWKVAPGGFGTPLTENPSLRTEWTTSDIWMRKTFTPGQLDAAALQQIVVRYIHDDDVDVYINGVRAYQSGGAVHRYENQPITAEAGRALRPGAENVLAVHCINRGGPESVDVGLLRRIPALR